VRTSDTRVGTIELAIPKVKPGRYFPSLLEPRRRAERALLGVVQEAYVHGVSTRKVDDLMKALGLDGVSKSEVSRMCAELDAEVEAFRTRALSGSIRISGSMRPTTRRSKRGFPNGPSRSGGRTCRSIRDIGARAADLDVGRVVHGHAHDRLRLRGRVHY
jgi:hypothetical protein